MELITKLVFGEQIRSRTLTLFINISKQLLIELLMSTESKVLVNDQILNQKYRIYRCNKVISSQYKSKIKIKNGICRQRIKKSVRVVTIQLSSNSLVNVRKQLIAHNNVNKKIRDSIYDFVNMLSWNNSTNQFK